MGRDRNRKKTGENKPENNPDKPILDINSDDFWDKMRKIIREEIDESLDARIKKLEERLQTLEDSRDTNVRKVTSVETSLDFLSDEFEAFKTKSLPALTTHVNQVMRDLTLSHLDQATHKRKWSVIISGLKGDKGEAEGDTRNAVIELGRKKLEVNDARSTDFTACHRLKQDANAPIIARFADLSKRDLWMANAKRLKNTNISISVDIPPCLRQVKKNLIETKKTFSPEVKRRSYIRHYANFPYFKLFRHDQKDPIVHPFSKEDIAQKCLEMDTPFNFRFDFQK